MRPVALLLGFVTLFLAAAQNGLAQVPDTLLARETTREAIRDHYHNPNRPPIVGFNYSGDPDSGDFGIRMGEFLGWSCSWDRNERCMGRDWNLGPCRPNIDCHPVADSLIARLLSVIQMHPGSGYATGQTVTSLARLGRLPEALEVVEACSAADWWCSALRGHVLHAVGRPEVSETTFREFVRAAPDSVGCELTDATWLLGAWSRRSAPYPPPASWESTISRNACVHRSSASDSIWWLADPLYVVEGNDRWAEHVNRSLAARAWLEVRRTHSPNPEVYDAVHWATVVRRGPPDSYDYRLRRNVLNVLPWWTGLRAARYHFVPDFEDGQLDKPTWRLIGSEADEGYTPAYAPFYPLPIQVARFRTSEGGRATSDMRLAVAGSSVESPIEDAAETGYLVLSDGPESFPLTLPATFHEGRVVYLAEAPAERYVLSFEVITSEGIGWHRQMLEPLQDNGPGISDVLLYEPLGLSEPDSLRAAAALMLGTTDVESAPEIGLFWEVYGAEPEQAIQFQLQIEGEAGGILQRVRRLLPGGSDQGEVTLQWQETSRGRVSPRAIVLSVEELDPGEYTIIVRARFAGQEPVEARRRITIR